MKMFYKKVLTTPEEPKTKKSWGGRIMVLISLVILGFGAFWFYSFASTVFKNWEELEFAMEKPALVKNIRTDYEQQQKKVDQSFLQKEESEDERITKLVLKKLETAQQALK